MIAWWGVPLALAQAPVRFGEVPNLDAQLFRPSLDRSSLMTVDVGERSAPGVGVQLMIGYHDDVLTYTQGSRRVRIVGELVQANFMAAFAAGPVRVGLDVPLGVAEGDALPSQASIGDGALDVRLTLTRAESPVDVALQGRATAPTSTYEAGLGWTKPTGSVAFAVSRRFGKLLGALNLGWRIQPRVELENVVVDDGVEGRLGLAYRFSEAFVASVEGTARLDPTDPLANRATSPAELLVAMRTRFAPDAYLRLGAGRGVTAGIGSPDVRLVAGIEYQPTRGDQRASTSPPPEEALAPFIDTGRRAWVPVRLARTTGEGPDGEIEGTPVRFDLSRIGVRLDTRGPSRCGTDRRCVLWFDGMLFREGEALRLVIHRVGDRAPANAIPRWVTDISGMAR
ncbi:MAG: hypothetical protein AAGA48_00075 [Myxococcota bacterium]